MSVDIGHPLIVEGIVAVSGSIDQVKMNRLAGLFHLKQGTTGFALVQGIIPSVVLNTFNTFICVGQSIFYNQQIPKAVRMATWWHACVSTWWIFFLVSYVASFFAVWLGKKVAQHYVH